MYLFFLLLFPYDDVYQAIAATICSFLRTVLVYNVPKPINGYPVVMLYHICLNIYQILQLKYFLKTPHLKMCLLEFFFLVKGVPTLLQHFSCPTNYPVFVFNPWGNPVSLLLQLNSVHSFFFWSHSLPISVFYQIKYFS